MLLLLALPTAFKPPSLNGLPLTRRQVLRGVPAAAAAAFSVVTPTPAQAEFLTLEKAQAQAAQSAGDPVNGREPFSGDFAKQGMPGGRMFELSSGGISAYQKLKLENALAELAKPAATATGQVKPALEAFLTTLPRVSSSSIAESDVKRCSLAANELSGLASSAQGDGLKATADSILKQSAAFEAAIQKKDSKKLAEAAISLADLLTDFAYAASQEEKPLAPLRNGAPLAFDPDKKRFDMPVSGKTI